MELREKTMDCAGDLKKETEQLMEELGSTRDITIQTVFLTIFCC